MDSKYETLAPLSGCQIALFGVFELPNDELGSLIRQNFGVYHQKKTSSTTHFIIGSGEIGNGSLNESQLPDSQICKIVKYDWLANSINLMEKQDEEPYVLTKEALLAVKKPKDTKRKKPMSEEDGSQTVEQISSKKSRTDAPKSHHAARSGHMQVLHDPQSATMVQDFGVVISNPQLVQDRLQKLGFDTGRNPLDRLREGTLIKALHTLQGMDEILRNPLGRHEHEFNYGLRQHEKILNALVGHNDDWSELSYVEYKKRFQKEVTRITSLRSMSNANQVLQDAHELKDKAHSSLRLKDINLVNPISAEFRALDMHLRQSHSAKSDCFFQVKNIFRTRYQEETTRFKGVPGDDSRLLWHGAPMANFASILAKGLRILPPVGPGGPTIGYPLGNGLHFFDMATKAVEHCDVGTKTGEAIIMLCEVLIESEDAFFAEKVQGCDTAGDASTLIGCNYLVNGKTKMRGWKAATQIHQDLSGVHMADLSRPPLRQPLRSPESQLFSEYVVYNEAHVKPHYLFHITVNPKTPSLIEE